MFFSSNPFSFKAEGFTFTLLYYYTTVLESMQEYNQFNCIKFIFDFAFSLGILQDFLFAIAF